jgi:hypothetical protein
MAVTDFRLANLRPSGSMPLRPEKSLEELPPHVRLLERYIYYAQR